MTGRCRHIPAGMDGTIGMGAGVAVGAAVAAGLGVGVGVLAAPVSCKPGDPNLAVGDGVLDGGVTGLA